MRSGASSATANALTDAYMPSKSRCSQLKGEVGVPDTTP